MESSTSPSQFSTLPRAFTIWKNRGESLNTTQTDSNSKDKDDDTFFDIEHTFVHRTQAFSHSFFSAATAMKKLHEKAWVRGCTFCSATDSFSGEIMAKMSLVMDGGAPGSGGGPLPNSKLGE